MTMTQPLQTGACARWSRFIFGQVKASRQPPLTIVTHIQNRWLGSKTQVRPTVQAGTVPGQKTARMGLHIPDARGPRLEYVHKSVVLFSTSQQVYKSLNSEKAPTAKKPLLKVLAQLTPHENIYTIPNILTFSRLIAAPIVGYLVLHDHHAWAVGLFAYAGITDLVDGWIARRWNLQTVVGTVIDPMADKTLMTILTVCLAIKGALPIWLAGIILGRDIGLAITAIYYRWISLPHPKTFSRYWDFSLPSAEVHPTTISKYNTALQLGLIGATTALPLVTIDVSTAMTAMQYLVATTTVWSGASYIYTKDAVKILNQEDKKQNEKSQGKDKADK